ncbi:MAG: GNAT family N-acetyltransferase [Lachnospiraceae bacterium]|nr:GNAT family N-acetyltransferase [Lachnospiraceae bacterium]
MIRYLEQEEKGRTRELWEEAFPDDSKSFVDYYYEEKMKDNRVLVFEREGQILSMLHRNPYRLWLRGEEKTCDYIVGVSTKISERGKGRMRSLMLAMLRDMQEEHQPFTFLMPSRESLYTPYDFRFVYDKTRWVLRYNKDIKRTPYKAGTLTEDLAQWQTAWLKRQYDVFAIRDEAYIERMDKELASEGGECRLIYDDDWFVGMESEWGLKEREMRYLYTGERYRSEAGTKPAIMARIVCLPEFIKHIRLKEDCPHDKLILEIGVNDLFIPQNQGAWLWRISKTGSELTQESRFISKGKMAVFTIAELTEWLFGYKMPSQVKNLPNWEYIETFQHVFLDEIV